MANFLKKNLFTVIIVVATVILGGVAIYTAIRLYQARQTTIAPTAPESKPRAQQAGPSAQCTTSFTVTAASGSPTPTGSASPTPTGAGSPSPTPTSPPQCNVTCTSNAGCPSNMVCSAGFCRNPSCTSDSDCICAATSPTPTTPTGTGATASPVGQAPSLPVAGVSFPTILGISTGFILLIGAVLLAL